VSEDPICVVCREPRSVHVPTEDGPLTCSRVARKEGRFVLVSPRFILGGGAWHDDEYVDPVYRFEPYAVAERADYNAARQLTSLEISKVLVGAIGGLLHARVPDADVHLALSVVQSLVDDGVPPRISRLPRGPSAEPWWSALCGLVGGLDSWCRVQDVQTAIAWTLEHWDLIKQEVGALG